MVLAICYILAKYYRQNPNLQGRNDNFPLCLYDNIKMGIKWKPGLSVFTDISNIIFYYLLTQWLSRPVCNPLSPQVSYILCGQGEWVPKSQDHFYIQKHAQHPGSFH